MCNNIYLYPQIKPINTLQTTFENRAIKWTALQLWTKNSTLNYILPNII